MRKRPILDGYGLFHLHNILSFILKNIYLFFEREERKEGEREGQWQRKIFQPLEKLKLRLKFLSPYLGQDDVSKFYV